MSNKPQYIIIHHTAVSREKAPNQFFAVNRFHRDTTDSNGNPLYHYGAPSSLGYYGAYHLFIEPDGSEYRYKEDWEMGAHTKGMNDKSIGVCLAGNFDVELPTENQIKTLRARLKELQIKYDIPLSNTRIAPHRKWANWKSCYGKLLADDWSYKLIQPNELTQKAKEKEAQIVELTSLRDLLQKLLLNLQIVLNLQSRQKVAKK